MLRHLASLLLSVPLVAQATFSHYVLTEPAPGVPAEVYAVDPATGAAVLEVSLTISGEPLAIVHDGFDGDLVVALDGGAGQSLILRLHDLQGSWAVLPMGTVPGRVCELAVALGELIVAVEGANGGFWRMPRRGGTAVLEASVPNLTAMMAFSPDTGPLALARSGVPSSPTPFSGTALYELVTGYYPFPMTNFSDPLNRTIVGLVDLPTALPRQLLAFDDGSFALYTSFGPGLTALSISQQNGNVAMHPQGPYGTDAMVLGGSPPVLSTIDPWGQTISAVSLALPGTPVDFAYGLSRSARSLRFGAPCGSPVVFQSWTGVPQLGSTLTTAGSNEVHAPYLLVAGLDDYDFGQLPAALPGGCSLQVRPDLVQFLPTGASGFSTFALTIPSSVTLVGTVVFTQWLRYDPAGLSSSSTAAHWIGN
ncbi:MAG: hypothetical protein ACE37K_25330 [Planctomycetota bacterium]